MSLNPDDAGRDLIAATRRRLPVRFDAVVTAEDAGAYKPAQTHFRLFERAHRPEEWVHVAQSHVHDLAPAPARAPAGVDQPPRRDPADPGVVTEELPDLTGLPAAVLRTGAEPLPGAGGSPGAAAQSLWARWSRTSAMPARKASTSAIR
ncbi:hypothetical protein AB0L05_20230 [Nonomuraea pusilla]|uniref:hypothetical protein n=1 Tax=Nonomuraea pusilla TaxID=46177 RepID=UPI003329B4BF